MSLQVSTTVHPKSAAAEKKDAVPNSTGNGTDPAAKVIRCLSGRCVFLTMNLASRLGGSRRMTGESWRNKGSTKHFVS